MAEKRFCVWCGVRLEDMRTDAMFCSPHCRITAHRAQPCTYCGMPANARDHVVSRRMREALHLAELGIARNVPDTVPACTECNSIAGAKLFTSVGSKRRYIKSQLRRRYRKALKIPHWTEAEIAELGYSLRRHVLASLALKQITRDRLMWPRLRPMERRALLEIARAERMASGLVEAGDLPVYETPAA